jgi:hypothetical protein
MTAVCTCAPLKQSGIGGIKAAQQLASWFFQIGRANCKFLSAIVTDFIAGQAQRFCFIRFDNNTKPVPSHMMNGK